MHTSFTSKTILRVIRRLEERGVAMVRRDLAGDRGAARQHLVLSSYQTFNLSMQTKAKGKRRPDARGFLVQLFGAAGEKGLRVE